MQNKLKIFFTALFLAVTMVACQSTDDGAQTAVEWAATPIADRETIPAPTPFVPDVEPLPTVERELPSPGTDPIPPMPSTPVPPGVYVKESDGFTFHYPTGWEVEEESGEELWLYDPEFDVDLFVESRFINDETSYEGYLEQFTNQEIIDAWELSGVEIVNEEELLFATDLTAQTATISTFKDDGARINVWIAYAESEAHEFFIYAFADPESLEARQTSLQQMLLQAEVGAIRMFGVDRDETVVMLGSDPIEKSLDPARTTGSAAGSVGMLYSGLVRMSPDLQVIPDLAESWQISDDGTTYIFTLRDGLTFASGRPLTTADIKASWERAAHPDTDSTTAATYIGDIVGVQEMLDGDADEISGIELIDDRTIAVTLDGPKPYFLAKLTYPVSFILNTETVDDADEGWVYEPDPSGAFTLQEYKEGEVIIFASNDAYYAPPEIGAVVQLIGRVGNRVSLYEAGEIDIAYLGTTDAEQVRQPSSELHDQWQSTTAMCTTFMQLNNENAPFDDVNVRRAFVLATDKEALNELVSEGSNLVAETIFPPAMPGYSAETAVSGYPYDPEAAQAALAESAYADGLPPIAITASGFGDAERDDLNAMIENWRDVLGAEVTISFLDPYNFTEVAREEEIQLASYGWCADYPDPENFVDLLYHTDSEFNISGYSNPEVDALLEEARVELDAVRRLGLYQEIETLLLADAATVPLAHGVSDVLVNPRLQGFVLAPMGAPVMHLLSFAPENGEE